MKNEYIALLIELLGAAKYYYFTVLPFLVRHLVYRGAKEGSQIDLSYLFFLKTGGEKPAKDGDTRRKTIQKARKKFGERSFKAAQIIHNSG